MVGMIGYGPSVLGLTVLVAVIWVGISHSWPLDSMLWSGGVILGLFLLVFLPLAYWAYCAQLICLVRPLDVKQAFRQAWPRLGPFSWTISLVKILLLALIAFPLLFTPLAAYYPLAGAILTLLSMPVMMLAAAAWLVEVLFVAPVVVLEGQKGLVAIRRARELMRGRFWGSLLFMMLAFALLLVFSSVVQAVVAMPLMPVVAISPLHGISAMLFLGMLLTVPLVAITIAAHLVLYFQAAAPPGSANPPLDEAGADHTGSGMPPDGAGKVAE